VSRLYNTERPHEFFRLGITCRECGNLEGHRLHASGPVRTGASALKQSRASQTQGSSPPEGESPDAAAKAEGSQECPSTGGSWCRYSYDYDRR
jgi:hypothetical protein